MAYKEILALGVGIGVLYAGLGVGDYYSKKGETERLRAEKANTCVIDSVEPQDLNGDGTPDVLKYRVNGVTLEYKLNQ